MPVCIDLKLKITSAHAGFKHTIFALQNGNFMGAGSNKQKQLMGTSSMTEFSVEDLKSVATSWHSSIFYSINSSKVIIWGESKFGLTADSNRVELPGKV